MGSSPISGLVGNLNNLKMALCPERQRGQTVNLLAIAFAGSSPANATLPL